MIRLATVCLMCLLMVGPALIRTTANDTGSSLDPDGKTAALHDTGSSLDPNG